MENKDTFMLGGQEFSSRFILGSGKFTGFNQGIG